MSKPSKRCQALRKEHDDFKRPVTFTRLPIPIDGNSDGGYAARLPGDDASVARLPGDDASVAGEPGYRMVRPQRGQESSSNQSFHLTEALTVFWDLVIKCQEIHDKPTYSTELKQFLCQAEWATFPNEHAHELKQHILADRAKRQAIFDDAIVTVNTDITKISKSVQSKYAALMYSLQSWNAEELDEEIDMLHACIRYARARFNYLATSKIVKVTSAGTTPNDVNNGSNLLKLCEDFTSSSWRCLAEGRGIEKVG